MKNTITKISLALLIGTSTLSCSKFDEINTNPTAANPDQVQVEYFINNSITAAQMDPQVAERQFVIYWKSAARQHQSNTLATGTYSDDYNNVYWEYISKWLNLANTAIKIADLKETNGSAAVYNENLKQVARIWRAYLLTEMSDNFGPVPVLAFQGVNPEFNSVEEVYDYALKELAEASARIDEAVLVPSTIGAYDPAYSYNWSKWVKYANSMRMRLSMRIAEVAPQKGKAAFEAAVATGKYINTADDNFSVKEKDGWNDLTGVMSRSWNSQNLSSTINNLFLGLGGIKSEDVLSADLKSAIKPANYIGKRYEKQFSLLTNDPSKGFWLDGLPYTIDPRAYKAFFIPLNTSASNFFNYDGWENDVKTPTRNLISGTDTIKVNFKNTWNAFSLGDWGAKGTNNLLRGTFGKVPALAKDFRLSTNARIFFASWESDFLIAEAALKGWAVPSSAKAAYEKGVKASFAYWGMASFADQYLASESYNRVGTSANFNHTTEPASSFTVDYIDGYTNAPASMSIPYPNNTIYKNGTVKNDALTKIITQKYLAQLPWLPLEAWNDHRRLGLPFFENPAIENSLVNLPELNSGNYMTNRISFFPQRLRYPSSFRNSDGAGYNQAVALLQGTDNEFTPLWWAKH